MKKAKFRTYDKRKIKNSTIFGIVFLLICFFCFFFLQQFGKRISPKLIEFASKNIEKLTYNLFNNYDMISEIDDETINNILSINKNAQNQIINVNYNMKNAYKITNMLAKKIQQDFQSIESGQKKLNYLDEELAGISDGLILTIPIGIVSNNIYLTNLGPKIPVKVKFTGTLLTNLKTRIKNYGINNSLIEVYVDVFITHEITAPMTFKNKEMHYEILLSAQLINGEVPSYYGGLYETKSNIINVPIE